MTLRWNQLIAVRERHRERAEQESRRERAAADATLAKLQTARQSEAECTAARDTLARQAMQRQDSFDAGSLRHGGAWHRVLQERLRLAQSATQAAGAVHAQQQQRADQSRQRLLGAALGLERATQVAQREHRADLALREQRAEDGTQELAVQRWRAGAGQRH